MKAKLSKLSINVNSPYRLVALAIVLAVIAGAAINLVSIYGFPITGFAAAGSGFVYINVSCTTSITLVNSSVAFGSMQPGASNDTRDTFPPPLYVRNDGNVPVNITIKATPLFTGVGDPNVYFGYACGNTSEHTCKCILGNPTAAAPDLGCNTTTIPTGTLNGTGQNGTQLTFSAIPINTLPAALVQYNFTFNDTNDELEIDINVSVPLNVSAGTKESNITVLAISTQPAAECV